MKQFKRFGLVVVALLCTVAMAFAAKPNIHILATGGTIAGTGSSATGTSYTAGQVAIGALLDAVPEIRHRQRNRRTDCENRFAGHERPGLADACQENQRVAETSGYRRHRDHSRNRHDGRNGLLPESDCQK